jgi:hypothetical protein
MENYPTRIVRFVELSSASSVVAEIPTLMAGLIEEWPRPLAGHCFKIAPFRGERREFIGQPIQAILPDLSSALADNTLHHAEWEVSEGCQSQWWDITPMCGCAASVTFQVNEFESSPDKQLKAEQDAVVRRLVDRNVGHVAATYHWVYGDSLVIYLFCLLVKARLLGGHFQTNFIQTSSETIFARLPQILGSQVMAGHTKQIVSVPAAKLSSWIAQYEKKIGPALREHLKLLPTR